MNRPEEGEPEFRFDEFEKSLREQCLSAIGKDDSAAQFALELWEGFGVIPDVEEERAYRMRNLMVEMGFLPPASTYSNEAYDIAKGKERDG